MQQVAEWWRVSPNDVYAWSCSKFADNQEYMFVQKERQAMANNQSEAPNLKEGERLYSGPKKDK